jgi:hypothetical protein
MGFTAYINKHNPHVAIHRDGCSEIRKRGGEHKYGQGWYEHFETYAQAFDSAKESNKPIWICSKCQPSSE